MQFPKEKEAVEASQRKTCLKLRNPHQAGLLKLSGPECDANLPHSSGGINRSRRENIARPSLWKVLSQDSVFPLEFLLSEPESDPRIWWSGDSSDQHLMTGWMNEWIDGSKMLSGNKFNGSGANDKLTWRTYWLHIGTTGQTSATFPHSPPLPWVHFLNTALAFHQVATLHIVHMRVKWSFPLTVLPIVCFGWVTQPTEAH